MRACGEAEGRYRLPMLVPGPCLLRVVAPGGGPEVAVDVLLNQTAVVNLALDDAQGGPIEEVQVAAQRLGGRGGASLSNAFGSEMALGVPVGQGFRDLVKLARGVQYTEASSDHMPTKEGRPPMRPPPFREHLKWMVRERRPHVVRQEGLRYRTH